MPVFIGEIIFWTPMCHSICDSLALSLSFTRSPIPFSFSLTSYLYLSIQLSWLFIMVLLKTVELTLVCASSIKHDYRNLKWLWFLLSEKGKRDWWFRNINSMKAITIARQMLGKFSIVNIGWAWDFASDNELRNTPRSLAHTHTHSSRVANKYI